MQRGGTPTAFDRVLSTKYGSKAMQLALEGKFGVLVSVHATSLSIVFGTPITLIPFKEKSLADFCVPSPPNVNIQSNPASLTFVFLIPAQLGEYTLSGNMKLMKVYI